MGRKSKQASSSTDGGSKKKKMKVSEENMEKEVPTIEDEEDVDEGPWDGTRVIGSSEGIPCHSNGCNANATATWVSQKTNDKWDMCDKCQLEDFGECYTGEENQDEVEEETLDSTKDDGDMENVEEPPTVQDSNDGAGATPELREAAATAGGAKDTSADTAPSSPNKDNRARVSEASVRSDSPSIDSSNEMNEQKGTDPVITQTQDEIPMAGASVQAEDAQEEEEEDEGQYDLIKILSADDILNMGICCSQDCGLSAFGLYVNNADTKDRWYYCLDCQEDDFDGWPPLEELPVKYLHPDHLGIISNNCSSRKNPPMPIFASSLVGDDASSTLSPKPGKQKTAAATTTSTANFVTPPPTSLSAPGSKETSLVHSKTVDSKENVTRNTKAMEAHRKWLEAAQAMGGIEARIVVSKPAAKKLIFDCLQDAFRPMNITQIYKGLKAVVPQAVLSACLQEMVPDKFDGKNPFDDSDDEDGEKKTSNKESLDPYSGSLVFKPGKGSNTSLYFVDYTKIKAMDYEERETLLNDLAAAKSEEQNLTATLKSTNELAKKLLAEPTNEELAVKLEAEEKSIQDLEEKIEDARKLKVNEKYRETTKRRVRTMAAQWRQRRRMCLDFLTNLEEITEGSLTRAKCLKGDGPLSLDSDEAVAKAAVQYVKDRCSHPGKSGLHKRKKLVSRGMKKLSKKSGSKVGLTDGLESDLVAVTLDKQLNIVRVYANED